MGSCPACSLCLRLPHGPSPSSQSPLPKAQTQGDLQFLGLWVQEPRRSLGWRVPVVVVPLHLARSGTRLAWPSLL